MSALDLAGVDLAAGCGGVVLRNGEQDACGKTATALIDDSGLWPVCTYHAHRYGKGDVVPLTTILAEVEALRAQVAEVSSGLLTDAATLLRASYNEDADRMSEALRYGAINIKGRLDRLRAAEIRERQ